jgi:hypothetical protein
MKCSKAIQALLLFGLELTMCLPGQNVSADPASPSPSPSPSPGACPTGASYLNPANPTGPLVTLTSLGITRCYYISASGSDSNSGTTESNPWLHAPGMSTCIAMCARLTPTAGDGFIFRGGDTWHVSSGIPLSGAWKWNYSGSSPSSPIYIGVDLAWYAGLSFARPIINLDNPLSTSAVSACSFADDFLHGIDLSKQSNVYLDSFEFLGACSTGAGFAGSGGYISNGQGIVENVYIHGWTLTSTAEDDVLTGIGGLGGRYLFNVIDGSDSTYGAACDSPSCVATTTQGATAWGMSDGTDVEYSVIRHVSNGIVSGTVKTLIGNLMEYQFQPSFGGTPQDHRHGNVVETVSSGAGSGTEGSVCQFYNNITRNTYTGVNWWPMCSTFYIFNNVWENSGHVYGNPPMDLNGLMLSPRSASGTVTAYVYNNTFQSVASRAGPRNAYTPGWASGSTAYFANNHIMGATSIRGFFGCLSSTGNTCSIVDNGGNTFQMTTAAANAQGYTLSNNYAPTSSSGATVGAGSNLASLCSFFSGDSALCSGTSGAVIEQDGRGGKIAVYPGIPVIVRPTTGAWNSGAYQY